MIKKVDHVVITTAILEDCLDFYKKVGFNIRNADGRYELFAGDFKINVHIKGQELSPHAAYVQTGSTDLCFEISSNLDALKSEFEGKGLSILLGIVERTGVNGVMRSIYLRDPDENLVEFCSYD